MNSKKKQKGDAIKSNVPRTAQPRKRHSSTKGKGIEKGKIVINGTYSESSMRSKRSVDTDSGVLVNNFITEETSQNLLRSDASTIGLQAKQLITTKEFSSSKLGDNSELIHSLGWAQPMVWSQAIQAASDNLIVDRRGVLSELKSATINFHNRSVTALTIHGNVPKSQSATPEDVSYRSYLVSRTIKPGATFSLGVKWRNTAGDVPHVVVMRTDTNKQQLRSYARLFDFLVTYDLENQTSGNTFSQEAKMLDVDVAVTYSASEVYPEDTKLETAKAFCLFNLKNFDNLYLVDPPVLGPFSMHSRRNLTGHNQFLVFATLDDSTIGILTSMNDSSVASPTAAIVYGQSDGDSLTLPYPVIIDGKGYNVARFYSGDAAYNATKLEGDGVWKLQENHSLSNSPLKVKDRRDLSYLSFPGPLVVGYIPGSLSSVPSQAKSRSKRAADLPTRHVRVRSLIGIIIFFEAATKILSIISDAMSKSKPKKGK